MRPAREEVTEVYIKLHITLNEISIGNMNSSLFTKVYIEIALRKIWLKIWYFLNVYQTASFCHNSLAAHLAKR
jgi:hypothetical protein